MIVGKSRSLMNSNPRTKNCGRWNKSKEMTHEREHDYQSKRAKHVDGWMMLSLSTMPQSCAFLLLNVVEGFCWDVSCR